jgi:hypothetical protein
MIKCLSFVFLTFCLPGFPEEPEKIIWEKNQPLPKVLDRDFHLMIRRLPVHEEEKFGAEPFISSSGVVARLSDGKSAKAELELIERYLRGGKEKKPLVVQMTFSESQAEVLKSAETARVIKGPRAEFIGLVHMEGRWNITKPKHTKQWPQMTGLPFPATKDDSYNLAHKYYNEYLNFENYPMAPGAVGFSGNHVLRWGGAAAVTYFGGNLLFAQAQAAFARGAARQFGKPWIVYYASWGNRVMRAPPDAGGNPAGIDNATQYDVQAPDVIRTGKDGDCRAYLGPRCGPDPAVSMRMCYYYSYMAGANLLMHENDSSRLFYANYDPEEKQSGGPASCFPAPKRYPSPVFRLYREIHAFTNGNARGEPYTPVAFLLDSRNGYIFPGRDTYFTFAPLLDGDYQTEAVLSTVFRYDGAYDSLKKALSAKTLKEIPAETVSFQNLPFGNFFDVIDSGAAGNIIGAYPVIMPLGLFHDDKTLNQKLINFVRDGGTMITDASRTDSDAPAGFYNVEFDKTRKKHGERVILNSKEETEETGFEFYPPLQRSAASLATDAETGLPVVYLNRFGKGRVIISAAPWFCDRAEGLRRKPLRVFNLILRDLLREYLPFALSVRSGSLDWSVNKAGKDWLVTLMNFDGIIHNYCQETTFDLSKTALAELSITGQWTVTEITSEKTPVTTHRGNLTSLDIQLKPGEARILKFSPCQ